LLDGEGEALTRTARERALDGNVAALRLAPRRTRPVQLDLPPVAEPADVAAAMAAVTAALAGPSSPRVRGRGGELRFEPAFEFGDERHGFGLAGGKTPRGALTADLGLDRHRARRSAHRVFDMIDRGNSRESATALLTRTHPPSGNGVGEGHGRRGRHRERRCRLPLVSGCDACGC
jgi:hypothetical protein